MQEQDKQTPVVDADSVNTDAPVAVDTSKPEPTEPTQEVAIEEAPFEEVAVEQAPDPAPVEPEIERESMEFDVIIVGGGPAGLSTAIRLRQLAIEAGNDEFMVCVVEKGSEFGAHTLSGAVIEPRALDELIPDWKAKGAPLNVPATEDRVYMLGSATKSTKLPDSIVPASMHNKGNYIVSLGNVVRCSLSKPKS